MRMRAWAWIMTENKNVKSRKLPATNQTPANRLPPRSFLVFAFNYLVHVKTFSVCFFHFLSMSQMEVTGSCKNRVHILHQLYQKNFSGSVASGLGEYF